MLALTESEWARLYKQVQLIALSFTRTSDEKQRWTARDRAHEAVQRACLRYLRLRPAGLTTIEALRRYLVAAVRSELGHVAAREEYRREIQGQAVAEEAALTGVPTATTPSAERLHLAQAEQRGDEERAVRLLRGLEKRLADAGDSLALATLACLRRGTVAPEAQARELGCDVGEIYNARKRRKRAMEQVLSQYAQDVTTPDGEREVRDVHDAREAARGGRGGDGDARKENA